MMASASTLKNPKGWFAAGAEVGQAMMILSDAAFKLFVYLCLNARRDQGVVHSTQTDMAKSLKKSHGTIRKCLREMEAAGICRCHYSRNPVRQGWVEITETYWPYQRQETPVATDVADDFVSGVRKILEARACIRCSLSTADEVLARQWYDRCIPLERIRQAVLLGCARKYSSWHNNKVYAPISSLRYFETILDEIDRQKISAEYWDYLGWRIQRIEKLWADSYQAKVKGNPVQSSGDTDAADSYTGRPEVEVP